MLGVMTALHVLICFGLIIVVLLQTGKGTGLASVFGGGGGETVFGGKGFGGMLAKATGVLAVLFMLTSITLSVMPKGTGQTESALDRNRPATEAPVEAPGGAGSQGLPQGQ
jgi:preprotein translocase subunit SecG